MDWYEGMSTQGLIRADVNGGADDRCHDGEYVPQIFEAMPPGSGSCRHSVDGQGLSTAW